ncbi:DUF4255 domain-containing protein [Rhodococcus aetherivorans]|uniref:DUF4255 domain-containing protein n=1 Tax=Rhodococcus aetherivorans TaxID=191292 RepID=UPI00369D3F5E
MISEVDRALQTLIEREAVHGTEVQISFEAPTKDWAARRNVPTVDVYLYDIREDLRRRQRGLFNEYDGQRVCARRLPPRHFKLSYLVTAWTQRPEDEHRLLAALLGCFLRRDVLPEEVLSGSLRDLSLPVPISIALPPPEDRSFADVWTALGGELKPSLDLVITAPTDTGRTYPAGPPVDQPVTLLTEGAPGAAPEVRHGRLSVDVPALDARAGADEPSEARRAHDPRSQRTASDSTTQSGGEAVAAWARKVRGDIESDASDSSGVGRKDVGSDKLQIRKTRKSREKGEPT